MIIIGTIVNITNTSSLSFVKYYEIYSKLGMVFEFFACKGEFNRNGIYMGLIFLGIYMVFNVVLEFAFDIVVYDTKFTSASRSLLY